MRIPFRSGSVFAGLAGLTLWIGAASCDDSESRKPACSEGAPHQPFTQFPSPPELDPPKGQCTPRCSYTRRLGTPSVDALPSGACDVDGYTCHMAVYDFCTTNGMVCECSDGTWSCFVESPGAGGCGGDRTCVVGANGQQSCVANADAGIDGAR